jgi:hypothetical protein
MAEKDSTFSNALRGGQARAISHDANRSRVAGGRKKSGSPRTRATVRVEVRLPLAPCWTCEQIEVLHQGGGNVIWNGSSSLCVLDLPLRISSRMD